MPIATKTKPIALFFQAENHSAHEEFHCPFCTKRLFDVSGRLVMVVDNPGPSDQFYVEVKCDNSRCQRVYRIFGPPLEAPGAFVPKITVNGKEI